MDQSQSEIQSEMAYAGICAHLDYLSDEGLESLIIVIQEERIRRGVEI